MRAFIVEDIDETREYLKTLLNRYAEIEVVGESGTYQKALDSITQLKPEVLFLDVELDAGHTGLELLENLRKDKSFDFQVVFVSAYGHYATQAIKLAAFDYLLKPVDPEELKEAIANLMQDEKERALQKRLDVLLEPEIKPTSKIVLNTTEAYKFVEIKKIIRLESDRNYTKFFIEGERPILVAKTMGEFEDILVKFEFKRVHKSHLVNMNFIKAFDYAGGGNLVFTNDDKIPVSKRKKSEVVSYIQNQLGIT